VPLRTRTAQILEVRCVPEELTAGNGRTRAAPRYSWLAVVPVGYSSGYPRALGNRVRSIVPGLAMPEACGLCASILMPNVLTLVDGGGCEPGSGPAAPGRAARGMPGVAARDRGLAGLPPSRGLQRSRSGEGL
jgi:hypothetical protein